MRIAVYHNLSSGGAKRALYEIVRRLCDRHQFDVYTLSSANHDFCDLGPYVNQHRIYEFDDTRMLQSPFGRLNMLLRRADLGKVRAINQNIAADIEGAGYDLLFANPCRIETGPSILSESQSLPKIYYCQEPPRVLYEDYPDRPYTLKSTRREQLDRFDPLPGMYFKTLRENDRQNFFAADLVLVNSRFMQSNVRSVYGKEAEVCYLGTDTDQFHPDDLERQSFVLSVGSLTPLKNFDFLIQAIARIPKMQRPALWIASNFQNPPERRFLEAMAAELNVQLKLLGNISDDELVQLYNQAAVTVYAPIREPFGLVPLEFDGMRNTGGCSPGRRHGRDDCGW